VKGTLRCLREATTIAAHRMLRRHLFSPPSRIEIRKIVEQHKCQATDQQNGKENRNGQLNSLHDFIFLCGFVFLYEIEIGFIEVFVAARGSRFFIGNNGTIPVSTASRVIRHDACSVENDGILLHKTNK